MTTWAQFDQKLELQNYMRPKDILAEAQKKWPGITEDEYDIDAMHKPDIGLYLCVTVYYSYYKRVVKSGDDNERHTGSNGS